MKVEAAAQVLDDLMWYVSHSKTRASAAVPGEFMRELIYPVVPRTRLKGTKTWVATLKKGPVRLIRR